MKKLCTVFTTDELIRIKKALNNANIDYVIKPSHMSLIQNLICMFTYRVVTPGLSRNDEVLEIYVDKSKYNIAIKLINC